MLQQFADDFYNFLYRVRPKGLKLIVLMQTSTFFFLKVFQKPLMSYWRLYRCFGLEGQVIQEILLKRNNISKFQVERRKASTKLLVARLRTPHENHVQNTNTRSFSKYYD